MTFHTVVFLLMFFLFFLWHCCVVLAGSLSCLPPH
jgi:hypothetical protein